MDVLVQFASGAKTYERCQASKRLEAEQDSSKDDSRPVTDRAWHSGRRIKTDELVSLDFASSNQLKRLAADGSSGCVGQRETFQGPVD